MIKVAIIGAGRAGTAFLRALMQVPSIQILGIADTRADAPGLRVAAECRLPLTTDPLSLIAHPEVDLLLDLTGDPSMSSLMSVHKPPAAQMLSGPVTVLLWSFLEKMAVLQRAVEDAHDAIFHLGLEGTILWANRQAEQVSGRSLSVLLGQPFFTLLSPSSAAQAKARLQAARDGQAVPPLAELEVHQPNGQQVPVEASTSTVWINDRRSGRVVILRDLTVRRELERQILHQAHFDRLTNLPNRYLFEDRLRQALARARRSGRPCALVYLDVDHFKDVNDRWGHQAGDRLLAELARRWQRSVRETDTVARFGGDEFVVILGELGDRVEALALAQRLQTEANAPIQLDAVQVVTTVSFGIAWFPDDGADEETLLQKADLALFQAKSAGRNEGRLFSEEMQRLTEQRVDMERELREAVEQSQFFFLYQPIINLSQSRAVGVEALIRWRHHRGVRQPDEFLPVAEDVGLLPSIGEWGLTTGLLQAKAWLDHGVPLSRFAINIAWPHLSTAQFVKSLEAWLRVCAFDPSLLELELTERTLPREDRVTVATLKALRNLGVRIALDDYGTGGTSLSHLCSFPITTLKIDRSFTAGLFTNPRAQAIVRTMLTLGQTLSFDVVAEGVEREEQARWLKEHGCILVQGYHYSPPLAADQIESFFCLSRTS